MWRGCCPPEKCRGAASDCVDTGDERNDERSRRGYSVAVPLLFLRMVLVRTALAATEACSSTAAHASATCASADSVTARTVASALSSASAMRWLHSSVSFDSSAAAVALQYTLEVRWERILRSAEDCLYTSHRASRRAMLSSCRSWARSSSASASASPSFSSSSIPVHHKCHSVQGM
jgi:hypothetical protein